MDTGNNTKDPHIIIIIYKCMFGLQYELNVCVRVYLCAPQLTDSVPTGICETHDSPRGECSILLLHHHLATNLSTQIIT